MGMVTGIPDLGQARTSIPGGRDVQLPETHCFHFSLLSTPTEQTLPPPTEQLDPPSF